MAGSNTSRRDAASPLGILTNTASGDSRSRALEAQKRREDAQRSRYHLQRTASDLLPGERVCGCGWRPIDGDITIVERESKHYVSNVQMCGSVWVCPVCGSKIAKKRSEELRELISLWESMGGSVWLLTLTVDHANTDELQDLLDRFTEAMRTLWAGGWAQRWRRRYGHLGMVRNLETTWGLANGWHPHAHALLFVGRFDHPTIDDLRYYRDMVQDSQQAAAELAERWQHVAAQFGFRVSLEHGATIEAKEQTDAQALGDYLEKMSSSWGMPEELTWSHIKQTKGARYTPFMLLAACDGDDVGAAPALFQEYADAFKGKRQLYGLAALRKRLGLTQEVSDEALVNERDEQAKFVCVVGTPIYCWIKARGLLPDLIAAGDAYGLEGLEGFLEWAYDCRALEAKERRRTTLLTGADNSPSTIMSETEGYRHV